MSVIDPHTETSVAVVVGSVEFPHDVIYLASCYPVGLGIVLLMTYDYVAYIYIYTHTAQTFIRAWTLPVNNIIILVSKRVSTRKSNIAHSYNDGISVVFISFSRPTTIFGNDIWHRNNDDDNEPRTRTIIIYYFDVAQGGGVRTFDGHGVYGDLISRARARTICPEQLASDIMAATKTRGIFIVCIL